LAKQLRLASALLTDVGRKRERNQDNVVEYIPPEQDALNEKGGLFVVCDGMGGHAAGEVASEIGVNTIREVYFATRGDDVISGIARAVKAANEAIYSRARQHPELSGMGTTCVALIVAGGRAYIVNIGDSRAYIVRDGKVRQVTQDHSWVAEQVRMGLLTEEQARVHAHRNVITRSLGTQPTITADLFVETIHEGDRIMLCSDGLYGYVDEQAMMRDIVALNSPEMTVRQLIDMANENGGPDNISSIIVDILEAPEVSGPVPLPPNLEEPIEEGTTQPLPAVADPKKGEGAKSAPAARRVTKSKRRGRGGVIATRIGLIAALVAIVVGAWYITLGPYGQQRTANQQLQTDVTQAQTAIGQAPGESPDVALAALATARSKVMSDLNNPNVGASNRQAALATLNSQLVPAVQTALQRYDQAALITPVASSAANTYPLTCVTPGTTTQVTLNTVTALTAVLRPTGTPNAPYIHDQFVFVVSAGQLYQVLSPLDATTSAPTTGAASCDAAPVHGYAQIVSLIPAGNLFYALAQETSGKYDVLSIQPLGFGSDGGVNLRVQTRVALPAGGATPTHIGVVGGSTYVSFTGGSAPTSTGVWLYNGATLKQTIALPQAATSLVTTNNTAYFLLTDGTLGQLNAAHAYQPLAVNVPDPATSSAPTAYTLATPVPTPALTAVTPLPTTAPTATATATLNPSATPNGAQTAPTATPPVTVTPATGGVTFPAGTVLAVDPTQPTNILVGDGAHSRVVRLVASAAGPGVGLAAQYVYDTPIIAVSQLALAANGASLDVYVWSNGRLATFPVVETTGG